jgi:hypothetical protein
MVTERKCSYEVPAGYAHLPLRRVEQPLTARLIDPSPPLDSEAIDRRAASESFAPKAANAPFGQRAAPLPSPQRLAPREKPADNLSKPVLV